MDLTSILLFCLISLVIGAVLMILVQYYAFVKYFNGPDETNQQRNLSFSEKYQLPDSILASVHSSELEVRNPNIAFNLILQFLFFELRNANKVRKWFHRKLSLELDELISKTTIGKLFDKLSIRDLDLGAQFPEIRQIKVMNTNLHETGHLEDVELVLDINYLGNFHVSIDADMVLGKKGFLSIKVKQVSGLARLQFTRAPYTHWSLCFLGDPVIELDIETQFQGRQMQSNVTSLISNQIRKAIRRKHTLPNYKLRYKPFFNKTIDDEIDLSEIQTDGLLDINVIEITRLSYQSHINSVFCVITLAPIPWVTARQNDDKSIVCVLDVEIHKAKNQQIGIVFKQLEQSVMVDAIIPNTPAIKAQLNKGDMLISIEGKKINNISSITKIVKCLNRPVFIMRIERIIFGEICNDVDTISLEETDVDGSYEMINDLNISFSKTSESVQIGNKGRQNSNEKLSTDSSCSNTPTSSPIKVRDSNALRQRGKSISRSNSESKSSINDDNGVTVNKNEANNTEILSNDIQFPMHTTIDTTANSFITMNDLCQFRIESNSMYLNFNIFGRCKDNIELLGYLNVPLQNVIYECNDSTLAHFIRQFPINPPDTPNLSSHPLSMQSGFDPNSSFGDILLSFSWSPSTNTETTKKTKTSKVPNSTDKVDTEKLDINPPRQHDFQRKHFQRSTMCDFCGKKIWLKDAVQCRECSMCCHKKCIIKCQDSTICGPVDATIALQQSGLAVEFKVTNADAETEVDDFEDIGEAKPKLDQHRQSFSGFLSQGIKRVNSANNLAIPAIVSSLNQGSRSLPPSPQHTPRKQSLINQSTNPFVVVAQRLDLIPDNINDITREQIISVTEPLIGWGTSDEMMAIAKTSSRTLFADMEPNERVQLINNLLSKLRVALDSETKAHATLVSLSAENAKIIPTDSKNTASTSTTTDGTSKSVKENQHDLARKAFLLGQSEERVQALSVIMLYLCTGLQHAQGIVNH